MLDESLDGIGGIKMRLKSALLGMDDSLID